MKTSLITVAVTATALLIAAMCSSCSLTIAPESDIDIAIQVIKGTKPTK